MKLHDVKKGVPVCRLPRDLEQAPRIVLEHHAFAVTTQVQNELPQGGFMQHIVGDDAVLEVLAHDAVSMTPGSPAVVVVPRLEIVAHTGYALCSLDQNMR